MAASKPLEAIQHTAARTTAYALAEVIDALLRPEERMEFCREAYALVRACLDAYEQEKSRLN